MTSVSTPQPGRYVSLGKKDLEDAAVYLHWARAPFSSRNRNAFERGLQETLTKTSGWCLDRYPEVEYSHRPYNWPYSRDAFKQMEAKDPKYLNIDHLYPRKEIVDELIRLAADPLTTPQTIAKLFHQRLMVAVITKDEHQRIKRGKTAWSAFQKDPFVLHREAGLDVDAYQTRV